MGEFLLGQVVKCRKIRAALDIVVSWSSWREDGGLCTHGRVSIGMRQVVKYPKIGAALDIVVVRLFCLSTSILGRLEGWEGRAIPLRGGKALGIQLTLWGTSRGSTIDWQ